MNPFITFLINDGIRYLLYFILFVTIYQFIKAINEKEINGRIVRKKVRSRLKKEIIKKQTEEIEKDNEHLGKLELLLRATSNNKEKNPSVFGFLLFCGSLGIGTFFLLFTRLGDLFISIGLACFVSMLPYLYLKTVFLTRKGAISNEITTIIEELIHHYSANGHDMYKAVKGVATSTRNAQYRVLFIQIASAMHMRQEQAVRDSVAVLVYSIGGTWAKRLGTIIQTGYIKSDSVLKALVSLSNDARNNEGMLKQEKAISFGTVIAAYATVPFFILTMVINNFLTRSFDYWEVQFGNPILIFLLVATCIMICLSLLTALYIRNPKNDI
ncbi:hypothetical protein ACWE42_23025 [Sutcliffiella cohnii]